MIEVEKKFILSENDKDRLIKEAQFLNERSFADAYYDTPIFSLTIEDKWLRARNGKFELKIPLRDGADRLADQYDEIDDEQKIREVLKLSTNRNLSQDLQEARYAPFCIITTTRRKYRVEPFILDIDTVDFGEFIYHIGEIELMVNEKSEIETAIQKILDFAKEKNLTIAPVRGKVIEYLKRTKPKHYQALIANVVKDF